MNLFTFHVLCMTGKADSCSLPSWEIDYALYVPVLCEYRQMMCRWDKDTTSARLTFLYHIDLFKNEVLNIFGLS